MTQEQEKYANLIISMTLDFKQGKIEWSLFKANLKLISDKINN